MTLGGIDVDESICEAIGRGDAKLVLNEALDWKAGGSRLRATHRLQSVLAVPITLVAAVPTFEQHRPTFLLHDGAAGKNNAYRLDEIEPPF